LIGRKPVMQAPNTHSILSALGVDEYELSRQRAERDARNQIEQYHQEKLAKAKEMFVQRRGLFEAVQQHITPALVSFTTYNGTVGTGFFQLTLWLVSNSHVVPSADLLGASRVSDIHGKLLEVDIKESFHRPIDRATSPDIAIVNIAERTDGNRSCLPTQFNGDEGFSATYLFYVDLQLLADKKPVVRPLKQLSKPGQYPTIYECEDGTEPQPGSSGSPIIEARVILGDKPKWQFRVTGILYARCSSEWCNQNLQLKPATTQGKKLVCAIPTANDFDQILGILRTRETASRYGKMAQLRTTHFKSDYDRKKAKEEYQASRRNKEQALHKLGCYLLGDTELDIALPEGLEKLLGTGIRTLDKSLLCDQGQKNALASKDLSRQQLKKLRIDPIHFNTLLQDCTNFLSNIKNKTSITLKRGDSFYTSPAGFLRIDVDGGSNSVWRLVLQDNTGKGHVPGTKKPKSSVFAIVRVQKDENNITGQDLDAAIKQSHNTSKAVDLPPSSSATPTKT